MTGRMALAALMTVLLAAPAVSAYDGRRVVVNIGMGDDPLIAGEIQHQGRAGGGRGRSPAGVGDARDRRTLNTLRILTKNSGSLQGRITGVEYNGCST